MKEDRNPIPEMSRPKVEYCYPRWINDVRDSDPISPPTNLPTAKTHHQKIPIPQNHLSHVEQSHLHSSHILIKTFHKNHAVIKTFSRPQTSPHKPTNLPTYLHLKLSATTQITSSKYHAIIFEPSSHSSTYIPTYATFRNPTNGAREAELQ